MRNLKRALSLALASVMLLGMMVVGASAASYDDFSDKDKIVNTEAVSMLVELGVLAGKDDGAFDPTGIVTRAEMAKMICVVLNGGKNPSLGNVANYSYTDTVGHWGAAYIEYCTNRGIVSGDGTGKFNPNEPVTGSQAAKMLLAAIGYQSAIEGFTGANWEVATNVLANQVGLYDELKAINPSEGLTRDNAAQMVYNALSVEQVTYGYTLVADGKGGFTSITEQKKTGETVLEGKFGAVKVEGVVVANEIARLNSTAKDASGTSVIGSSLEKGKTTILVTNYEDQKEFKDIENTFTVTTDATQLGRAVTLYVKPASSSVKSTVIGNVIVNADNKVVVDYTGDSISDVAADNDLDVDSALVAKNFAELSKLASADAKDKAVPGVEKVLIDNDNDGNVDYVLLNAYVFGKVTAYSTTSDGSITVTTTSKGITETLSASDKDDVVGFADVAKNDYVLAEFIGGMLYVEKAETVTGKLDAYKSGSSLTVDGTKYNVSKVSALNNTDITAASAYSDSTKGASDNLNKEATFYLDAFGYVIAVGDVAATAGNYALVWKADTDAVINRSVKVTLSDGTTATYALDSKSDAVAKANFGSVYAYTLSGNTIKLTSANKYSEATSGATFTKGKTTIGGTKIGAGAVANQYATSTTAFFYVSMKADNETVDKVNVYTGYASAPTLGKAGAEAQVALNKSDKVMAVAFTGANLAAANVSDHLFVYSWGNTYKDYTEANVILAGKDTTETIKVDVDASKLYDIKENDKGDDYIYLYTINSDGYYVLGDTPDYKANEGGELTVKGVEGDKTPTSASSTTFVIDNKEFKVVADSVLVDNTTKTPTASLKTTPSTDDTVLYVLTNKDDEALMIVIDNKTDSTPKPPVPTSNVTIIASDATNDYAAPTYYVEDATKTPTNAELRAALIAKMTADGCTNISFNGWNVSFTQGGASVGPQAVDFERVYKVTAGTVTSTGVTGGTGTITFTASVPADTYVKATQSVTLTLKLTSGTLSAAAVDADVVSAPVASTMSAGATNDSLFAGSTAHDGVATATTKAVNVTFSAIAADTVLNVTLENHA